MQTAIVHFIKIRFSENIAIDDGAQKIVHLMLAHQLPKHHLEEMVEVGAMTFQIIAISVEIDTIVA